MSLGESLGCYAFKGACAESFLDHSIGTAQCVDARWELRGIVAKLGLICGVDRQLVRDFAILSSLLHDIGKVDTDLQVRCEKTCEEFQLHYVTSAQLLLLLARRAGMSEFTADALESFVETALSSSYECPGDHVPAESWLYLFIVLLPVLIHHYAQIRDPRRLVSSDRSRMTIWPECASVLKEVAERGRSMVGTGLARRLLLVLSELSEEKELDLPSLPFKREHLFSSDRVTHQKFVAEAVAGVLNLCDGTVASRNRC